MLHTLDSDLLDGFIPLAILLQRLTALADLLEQVAHLLVSDHHPERGDLGIPYILGHDDHRLAEHAEQVLSDTAQIGGRAPAQTTRAQAFLHLLTQPDHALDG